MGLRKLERQISRLDLEALKSNLPAYSKGSIWDGLKHSIFVYVKLRKELYTADIALQIETETKVMEYFETISKANA